MGDEGKTEKKRTNGDEGYFIPLPRYRAVEAGKTSSPSFFYVWHLTTLTSGAGSELDVTRL